MARYTPQRRYRKWSTETWADEKFRRLSPLPPSAQSLWFVFVCGPQTTNIPGVFSVGRAALAERLGWSLEALDAAVAEVTTQGMAIVDWSAPLVLLPNALRHNIPEAPNVVWGWRDTWRDLPECALKQRAEATLREGLVEHAAAPFVAAFDDMLAGRDHPLAGKPTGKASRKASKKAGGKPSRKAWGKPSRKAWGKPSTDAQGEAFQEGLGDTGTGTGADPHDREDHSAAPVPVPIARRRSASSRGAPAALRRDPDLSVPGAE